MKLRPGCRFILAPHFHLTGDVQQRLLLGPGVQERDGRFLPIAAWRPPTADELAMLLPMGGAPEALPALDTAIALFQLPAHICAAWWQLLEESAQTLAEGRIDGFERFASQVGEFLAFKGLPVPAGARCAVVVRTLQHSWPRLWACINLGDEEAAVVLLNLTCAQLDAEVRHRFPDQQTAAGGELIARFLRCCADYPTVRLMLAPGQGFLLPPDGVVLDHYAADKSEPDVLMLISRANPPLTGA
jgi:hypothetical protein